MAPIKNGGKGNGSILSYFKNHIIPPHKWVNNDTPADEIVVAPRPAASASSLPNDATPEAHAPTSTPPKEKKRKRVRPATLPSPVNNSSTPRSSQTSNASASSRRRARPQKEDTQQMRDDQLRSSSSPHTLPLSKTSTPRKSPTRFNINPLDGTPTITPTKDLPFRSPSCTPTKTRIAAYVEIPSSPLSRAPSSPMVDHTPLVSQKSTISPVGNESAPSNAYIPQGAPASAPAPDTTSVPATSSLTSLPPSSVLSDPLASSTASSRRVTTKSGLQGIKDSDSEDDSSSDDDLPPVTSFVKPLHASSASQPSKRVKLSPPEPESRPSTETLSFKYRSWKAKRRSPPRPKFRTSIAEIAAESERWQKSRETVERLEMSVAQAKQEENETDEAHDDAAIDGEMLVGMAGSDSDDQDRMIKALQRTEALHDEQRYYFFLDEMPRTSSNTPFPGLPDETWARLYQQSSRSFACTSGLAAELASIHPLPSQVTGWMIQELCHEPGEALCEAYVEILKNSLLHQGSVSDSWSSFNSMYRTRSFFSTGTTDKIHPGLPPGLLYMIQIVSCLAPHIDNERPDAMPLTTCNTLTDLALMNVDEHVCQSTTLKTEITAAVEAMLDALSDDVFDKLVTGTIEMFFSPTDLPLRTRYQAIALLPAGTVRAGYIRRRLALACFSDATDRKATASQDWARSIQCKLDDMPELHISAFTDYRLLKDLIAVLDIAIAGGWTDHAQLVVEQPASAWGSLPPASDVERQHNAQIDKICRRLEFMSSKILDAGTSHLRRTEAKTSIEQLIVRLEHGVRARPRPRKGVFGSRDDEHSYQRSFKQATFRDAGFTKQDELQADRVDKETTVS